MRQVEQGFSSFFGTLDDFSMWKVPEVCCNIVWKFINYAILLKLATNVEGNILFMFNFIKSFCSLLRKLSWGRIPSSSWKKKYIYIFVNILGLFQGVTDNKVTLHEFALQLERKTKGCQDEADDVAASYPSLLAITARHGLINPMDRLIYAGPAHAVSTLSKNYQPMDKDLACDIHIINLRTMIKSVSGLKPADQVCCWILQLIFV